MQQSEANFKIPIALDDKCNLVKPSAARGEAAYSCPECATKLIFRHGQIKAPHFSHPPAKNCTAESALHKAAKLAIKQVVDERCQGGKEPTLVKTFTDCGQPIPRPLSDVNSGDVGCTTLEHKLPSGHIADVALLKDQHVLLCIEILVTHRVDQHKAQTLKNDWLELKAETAIDDPTTWLVIQSSLNHPRCNSCARRQGEAERSQQKQQEDAERSFRIRQSQLG